MRVALVNHFHAGDVIMSRAIIRRVRPLLIDKVALELHCQPAHAYLWSDLGLPHRAGRRPGIDDDVQAIDLWFGQGGDMLGVTGMSHATQVTVYNRQAARLGLPTLDPAGPPGVFDFADIAVTDPPGVLLENGPVLSGQPTHELNPHVAALASKFPKVPFYCVSRPPEGVPSNVVDVSSRNLIQISALSGVCRAMVARLSAPFVASLTQRNVGRLPRLAFGSPIGCPIWDERDVQYYGNIDAIVARLREILT